MHPVLRLILLLVFAAAPAFGVHAAAPAPAPTTFYIQVIRGTDNATPEKPSWKPVGPKLGKALSPVFRWQYYWQAEVKEVHAGTGMPASTPVAPDREVRIVILPDGQPEVSLFRKGELRRKVRVRGEENMTIMGGEAIDRDGWFIVVRRDKPSVE